MSIEPDSKDWTWVLRERCPDCGFESWSFPREQLGAMIRANAEHWSTVLQRTDVRERPDAATWSPLEYACHVRDVFTRFDERLHLMLDTDDPRFPNWDQDVTAIEGRYDEQEPGEVADQLAATAATVADSFDTVIGDQWERPGRRSDGASFTVETLGRYFAHDWIHHLWDVGDRSPAT